jgi:hypothetical protein
MSAHYIPKKRNTGPSLERALKMLFTEVERSSRMLGRIPRITIAQLKKLEPVDLDARIYAITSTKGKPMLDVVAVAIPYRLYSVMCNEIIAARELIAQLEKTHALKAAAEIANLDYEDKPQ